MGFLQSEKNSINDALNEATILDMAFDQEKERISVTISPIWADKDLQADINKVLTFVFRGVGRFMASSWAGRWDDKSIEIIKFEPQEIRENVRRFHPFSIYGQMFLDGDDSFNDRFQEHLSFSYVNEKHADCPHTFEFSRDTDSYLAVKFWFVELDIFDSKERNVAIQEFVEGSERAWKSPETLRQFGIQSLRDGSK